MHSRNIFLQLHIRILYYVCVCLYDAGNAFMDVALVHSMTTYGKVCNICDYVYTLHVNVGVHLSFTYKQIDLKQ